MALTAKSLADGQLGASRATIYQCPADKTASHVFVMLANISTANTYTGNLYIKRSGVATPRRIIGAGTSIAASGCLQVPAAGNTGIKLSTEDELQGDASTADVIDYFVHGGEE